MINDSHPLNLKGKRYLMVGGGGYLTLPACQLLAQLGASIFIADRNEKILANARNAVCDVSPDVRMYTSLVDSADESSSNSLVEQCISDLGGLDGFVYAPAASSGKRLEHLSVEDFENSNRVNLIGSLFLAKRVAENMEPGGSVVLISSMYGCVAPDPALYPSSMVPNSIEYGISKAGMLQMVRYLAAHYGSRGVRFNALIPGPFPNPSKYEDDQAFVQRLADKTMLGRVGKRDEIAGAMVFLLTEMSSYMTGQSIIIDGGWTAW